MDFTLYNQQLKRFINWLIPKTCMQCARKIRELNCIYCEQCSDELPYSKHSCHRCGQPFSGFSNYCGRCVSKLPAFDACFCAFEYSAPISNAICRFKYAEQPQMARYLARLMIDELLSQEIEIPEAIIAVPMHRSSLRKRGYNQSHELAKHFSKRLNVPLLTNTLSKTKATPRQATQSLSQRKINQKGSFQVVKDIKFNHIAIVDDVVTTGATAQEIAKTLKKNGVDYVQVWGIARTS